MCPLLAPHLPRTFQLFSFFFLLQPLTVLIRHTRQAVCAINQSIFPRCLWLAPGLLFWLGAQISKVSKNRLLKVCNVPSTSAGLNTLLFLLQPLTVLMKQTRQAVRIVKQSIFLRCLWPSGTPVLLAWPQLISFSPSQSAP